MKNFHKIRTKRKLKDQFTILPLAPKKIKIFIGITPLSGARRRGGD